MKRNVREATKLFLNPIINIMMSSLQKTIYLIMVLLSLATELAAQNLLKDTIGMDGVNTNETRKSETINWLQLTMDGAIKKAKAERKDILVYFTAKWCGPCLKMDQEVFSNQDVISVVNDNYIPAKIDIDSWSAKKWKADFRVKGVPDFYILNSDKKRLRHYFGGMELNQVQDFLNLKEPPADINMLDTTLNSPRKLGWKNKVELGIGAGCIQDDCRVTEQVGRNCCCCSPGGTRRHVNTSLVLFPR
ncbi:MAG: thioredoxin, partial [Pedobacter sp.]